MPNKSQFGAAALASVPTLTTKMRGEKQFGGTEGECKHKEKGERGRKMDETERNKISEELQKHSHPLMVKSTDLYHIVNGQVAPSK